MRTEFLRKDFGNEHPDDRALPDRMRKDEEEDAGRRQDIPPEDKGQSTREEGNEIADAAPDQHLTTPDSVDEEESDKGSQPQKHRQPGRNHKRRLA